MLHKNVERDNTIRPDINLALSEPILSEHGLNMRAVRVVAMDLTEKYPDNFLVIPTKNDLLSTITACTIFEVTLNGETIKFHLSVAVTSWQNGRFENRLMIREEGKNRDGLSYRLDVDQGKEIDEEYLRVSKLEPLSFDVESEWQQAIKTMFYDKFEMGKDGILSSLSDNYLETTIETEMALLLLKKAGKLKRPQKNGTRGVSLKEFREMLSKNQGIPPNWILGRG